MFKKSHELENEIQEKLGRLGMRSEWNVGTISEVCSLVTDGSHFSPKSFENGEYMVSVKDFNNCKRISIYDYDKLKSSGCIPEIGDILIGKDGARFFEDIIIYNQPEKPAILSSIAILILFYRISYTTSAKIHYSRKMLEIIMPLALLFLVSF